MKLFIIHCGFYDPNVNGGIYESHTNYYVAAADFADARVQAKALPEFKKLKMHIDGIQELVAVAGHQVVLKPDASLKNKTLLRRQKFGSTKETLFEMLASEE